VEGLVRRISLRSDDGSTGLTQSDSRSYQAGGRCIYEAQLAEDESRRYKHRHSSYVFLPVIIQVPSLACSHSTAPCLRKSVHTAMAHAFSGQIRICGVFRTTRGHPSCISVEFARCDFLAEPDSLAGRRCLHLTSNPYILPSRPYIKLGLHS
jgi:hypothetical protein